MVSDWYRIETKKAGIAHHYKIEAICEGCCFHSKFLVKLFNFPEFSSKHRLFMANLGKNWQEPCG
jgi:hypothetical protein